MYSFPLRPSNSNDKSLASSIISTKAWLRWEISNRDNPEPFKSLTAAGETDSLKVYQQKLNRSVSLKKTKTTKSKNKVWFIQFGAYSKKDSAEILKESLREDGLKDIQVNQVMNRGKMIYYVRSTNVKSYSSVKKQADKLKKMDIDFIISGY